ncbi:MAG: NADP-dependent oxidoreductase [Bacteroidia bacterium]|nr:NADP-dependent oxidoreductase [Bacteroidia bacterium]
MKALQVLKYGDLEESLAFREVSKPGIGATDVLIVVRAAAINPIDKSIILGNLQHILPIPLPSTSGYDVSGIVVEKGDQVSNFDIGDSVYARLPQKQMGSLAEYAAVDIQAVSLKPENISFEEAASLPLAGLTALQSLEYVGLKDKDKILIHAGSGGVGSFAIQFAKAKGAHVYTTTSTRNVSWVKELGADRVIDYKTEEYKSLVSEVDIVFDTLGKHYTEEAFQLIKQGGKVVSIAGPIDEEGARIFGMNEYKLPEALSSSIHKKEASYKYLLMHPNGTQLAEIKSLLERGKIKAVIDEIYSFEESIEAFKHLASGRAKGKIVIKIT